MSNENLRDQFAMAAMQSILNRRDILKEELPAIANAAYSVADAMIAEKDKRNVMRAQSNPHHGTPSNFFNRYSL